MAVPFTRLASQVLDHHETRLNNALKAANGVISVLGSRGRIQMVNGGGENFKERILFSGNTNIGFRGKNATIPTNDDEGITMASVPQRVIDGSIVINQVERDQARGPWAIGRLMQDKIDQFETSWVQKWAEVLLQATPGANDPFSLLPSGTSGTINGILSPVAPASAAGTTAGISRADNDWWRNQYTNTSIDLSTEAGDDSFYNLLYSQCIFGASRQDEPDFGLTSFAIFGNMGSGASAKRRGTLTDQGTSKLGFRNLVYYNATMIQEVSTRIASKVALLNTRDIRIAVLKPTGGSTKQVDQQNNLGSIPVAFRDVNGSRFQRDINSLNDVAVGYIVAGLVPRLLRTHGLADNVS